MIQEQQHYKISADELSDNEDTSDNPYETAAGSQGNLDMATLFVEAGAHINPIEYAHLNSPLSWANYKGHKKIVDYLAQHGGTTHSDEFYVMP
jgi:ankyrin repeat protein